MADLREGIKAIVEDLKTQRDDIKVRLHLAEMEAKDEWKDLEKKWSRIETEYSFLTKEIGDITDDVRDAAEALVDEIGAGYSKIKKDLQQRGQVTEK